MPTPLQPHQALLQLATPPPDHRLVEAAPDVAPADTAVTARAGCAGPALQHGLGMRPGAAPPVHHLPQLQVPSQPPARLPLPQQLLSQPLPPLPRQAPQRTHDELS